jgi:hypothetical protein
MYCIKCGVKLSDNQKACPLCGTVVFHPEIMPSGDPLYPPQRQPAPQVRSQAALVVITTLFLLPMIITALCDLQLNKAVTWCGYVIGALAVSYVILVLPYWFRQPNPVVFVPCGFAAVGLILLYISIATSGGWFLSFAFPVTGAVGLIVTAVVALLKYVGKGELYIFGGAFALLGGFMPVMEWLLNLTFGFTHGFVWSLYPLTALVLLGGMLIFLAICRPARETMERKFFL